MSQDSHLILLPDTNILIHHGRNDALDQWIETRYSLLINPSQPVLSIVIVGEILALAGYRGWGAASKQRAEDFIAQCRVLPLEYPGILDAYIELYTLSRRAGRTMGDNDLWIAATARVTGATILTTDKDFDHLAPTYIQRDWIDPTTH